MGETHKKRGAGKEIIGETERAETESEQSREGCRQIERRSGN